MTDIHITEGFDEYEIDGVPARVICVDAPGAFPVIVLLDNGLLLWRGGDELSTGSPPLVKQKHEPRDIWIWEAKSGALIGGWGLDKGSCHGFTEGKPVKFVEVLDDE